MRFLFFIILFLSSLVCNARQITTANLAQFSSSSAPNTFIIPAGDTVTINGPVTINSDVILQVYGSLTLKSTLTNNGTIILNNRSTVNISNNVTNNSGGTITVSANATLTLAKYLTNKENGIINIYGKLEMTGNDKNADLCNMGDISVISTANGFAVLHVKHDLFQIEYVKRHDEFVDSQGLIYLSNSLLRVDGKIWVGDDKTHLEDRGIIVKGDKDTYILVEEMTHNNAGKNWLTVIGNSELYIVSNASNSKNAGINPGTAAVLFEDDNKVWEFVVMPGKTDALFVDGDYTYYKMDGNYVYKDKNGKIILDHIAGMPEKTSYLYFKVPNNIHVSGGIHAGGYPDMNQTTYDKNIGYVDVANNKNYRDIITLLPVELETFEVALSNNTVDFYWATASEKNAKHFETQVSFDGIHFNTMQKVEANGTTSERHNYSTTVSSEKFPVDLVYFRLKMVDNDASYQYSNVVSLLLESNAETLTVYPNPASEYITISGNFKSAVVVDRSGRNVAVQPMSANMLNIAGLSVGTYYVVVTTDNGKTVLPFVKE